MKKFVSLLILLFFTNIASASYITMQTNNYFDDDFIYVNATNFGDEPAYNVQIISNVFNKNYVSETKDILNLKEILSFSFGLNNTELKKGTYPLFTKIKYNDANNYPFSAISALLIKNKESSRSDIIIIPNDNIKLNDKKNVKINIKNIGDELINLKLYALLPDEISAEKEKNINMGPRSDKDVFLRLNNLAARLNSNYNIYIIAEYEKDNMHYSSLALANVNIKKERNFFNKNMLYVILILLIIVFIILQRKKKWI